MYSRSIFGACKNFGCCAITLHSFWTLVRVCVYSGSQERKARYIRLCYSVLFAFWVGNFLVSFCFPTQSPAQSPEVRSARLGTRPVWPTPQCRRWPWSKACFCVWFVYSIVYQWKVDSTEMAQLLNKPPDVYEAEKRRFLKDLKQFHTHRG